MKYYMIKGKCGGDVIFNGFDSYGNVQMSTWNIYLFCQDNLAKAALKRIDKSWEPYIVEVEVNECQ